MVGFGPTLWSRRIGETEYGVKAIPLGGYIRMIGMFPPSRESNKFKRGRFTDLIEDARSQSLAEVTPQDEGRTFYSLSAPKKLVIMFGGPVTNLIIATVLFGAIFVEHGVVKPTTTAQSIVQCVPSIDSPSGDLINGQCVTQISPAADLQLMAEDRIVSINRVAINSWGEFGEALRETAGKEIPFTYERDGQLIDGVITPASVATELSGNPVSQGFIGIVPVQEVVTMPLSELPSEMMSMTANAFTAIIQFPISAANLVANLFSDDPRDPNGPVSVVGVGKISGDIAAMEGVSGTDKLIELTGLIAGMNLFLFVFNMVPLLPLDGGHIAGGLFEGFRRTLGRVSRRIYQGPADTAKLLPVTYVVSIFLLLMGGVVILADIFKPISF